MLLHVEQILGHFWTLPVVLIALSYERRCSADFVHVRTGEGDTTTTSRQGSCAGMTFMQQQAADTFWLGDSLRERGTQANREDVSGVVSCGSLAMCSILVRSLSKQSFVSTMAW